MDTPRIARRTAMVRLAAGAFGLTAGVAQAWAPLRVEVSGVGAYRVPVGVAPLEGEGGSSTAPRAIPAILQADFERSGMLSPVALPPGGAEAADIASAGPRLDAVVRGTVLALADGRLEIRWTLWDAVRREEHIAQQITVASADLRLAAHRIADAVQQALTGVRGVNATRIAYVVQEGPRHLLKVADADGHDARVALASVHPIISPAWSPDGAELAYVSFEGGRAQVFTQHLASGRRAPLAALRAPHSAPTWSPDGRRVAFALARDGVTQVHVVDRDGGALRRVTSGTSIDTEPAWSPDGAWLYFVSDRSGPPQVYRTSPDGERTERITFGGHCVSPCPSPDGRQLAYVSKQSGALRVMVKDLETGALRALTDGDDDERPSFAPNGRLLAYASRVGGRDRLMTTALDGGARLGLASSGPEVREPAWGPWLPATDTAPAVVAAPAPLAGPAPPGAS